MLLSHKTGFRAKKITKDRETLYIYKGSSSQRKHGNPKCIYSKHHTQSKNWQNSNEVDKSPVTVGVVNNPLLVPDRTIIQKVSKYREELSDIINQQNLIGIYRTLHPISAEYIFHTYACVYQDKPHPG